MIGCLDLLYRTGTRVFFGACSSGDVPSVCYACRCGFLVWSLVVPGFLVFL